MEPVPPPFELRTLTPRDREPLLRLLGRRPGSHVIGLGALQAGALEHGSAAALVTGAFAQGRLLAANFSFGGSALWVAGEPEAAAATIDLLHPGLLSARLLAGPEAPARAAWQRLQRHGRRARFEVSQLVCELARPAWPTADSLAVRRAHEIDLDDVLDASCRMHAEELGVPAEPWEVERYRHAARVQVEKGRSWCLRHAATDRLIFKAAIAHPGHGAAMLEGIWVAPGSRRAGVASRALRGLCGRLLERFDLVSLVVNADNAPARALYAKLGFVETEGYLTVHLDEADALPRPAGW